MGVIELAAGLPAMPVVAGEQQRGGRTREVWVHDEKRLLDRAAKMIARKGDALLLRCGNELCPDRVIKLVPDASAESGAVLRCGCTDRSFLKA